MAIHLIDTSSKPTSNRTPQEEVAKMAKYKRYDSDQGKFIPVSLESQIQPGTFEFTSSYLINNKVDLSVLEELYRKDEIRGNLEVQRDRKGPGNYEKVCLNQACTIYKGQWKPLLPLTAMLGGKRH